jgi:hypothetical protein
MICGFFIREMSCNRDRFAASIELAAVPLFRLQTSVI